MQSQPMAKIELRVVEIKLVLFLSAFNYMQVDQLDGSRAHQRACLNGPNTRYRQSTVVHGSFLKCLGTGYINITS